MLRRYLFNNFLYWKISAFSPRNPRHRCFFYPKNSLNKLFLSCKVHAFLRVSLLLSQTQFVLAILKELLNLLYEKKCEAVLRNFPLSEFSMAKAWYRSILVASKIPWNSISILQKPRQRRQYFHLNLYQSLSNIPYKE